VGGFELCESEIESGFGRRGRGGGPGGAGREVVGEDEEFE
jgi:hypothetical protein